MTRDIKLKTFIIVMAVLVVLEIILLFVFSPKNQNNRYSTEYCQEAVCNEDASICYHYDVDQYGNTIVVWRGSCQK